MRCLLVLLLFLPLAGAAPLLDDPAGDVTIRVADRHDTSDATGRFDPVDLQALEIEETASHVHFTLAVAGLPADGVAFLDDSSFWILFKHGEEDYGVSVRRAFESGGPVAYRATLHPVTNDVAGYGTILEAEIDETGTITVSVPRKLIPDETGLPPRPGGSLSAFEALGFGFGTLFLNPDDDTIHGEDRQGVVHVRDRMPDSGPTGRFGFQIGVHQEGDLELRAASSVRVSNGGAGIYIYEVQAINHGDAARQATLTTHDVPPGWAVRLPFAQSVIKAGEARAFPVMVSVPSGHEHGGLELFRLELADGGHVGRTELGLQYTAVPQPAGHHDTVWLHGRQSPPFPFAPGFSLVRGGDARMSLYMNTLEDDPAAVAKAVPGEGPAIPGVERTFGWRVPLAPALAMGLHFDGTGEIQVPVEYDYLGSEIRVGGRLVVEGEGRLTVATIRSSGAGEVTRGVTTLEGAVEVAPGVARVPFAEGQALVLELNVTGRFDGGPLFTPDANPRIAPGGFLRLPLQEYQDALEDYGDGLRGIELRMDDVHREANAASQILVQGLLRNKLGHDMDIRLGLEGFNVEWADLSQERIRVPAGGERDVLLRVQVPEGAAVGEAADIAVTAVDVADPFHTVFARLSVVVVAEPVPDDAEALLDWADAEKRSPGPGLVAILAAAVAARRLGFRGRTG